jgi:hypothetical protein
LAILRAEATAKVFGFKLGRPSHRIPKRRVMWSLKFRVRGPYGRIDGYEAIRYARKYGVPISKYDEPEIEAARNDLTPEEAEGVASDRDPWLVYVDAMRGYVIETDRNGRWTSTGLCDDPRENFFGDEEAAQEAIDDLRAVGPEALSRPYRIVAVSVRNGMFVRMTAPPALDLYTAYINDGEGGVKTFEAAGDNAALERARKWADKRERLAKHRRYRLRVMRQWHEPDTGGNKSEGQDRWLVETVMTPTMRAVYERLRGTPDSEAAIAVLDGDVTVVPPQRAYNKPTKGRR